MTSIFKETSWTAEILDYHFGSACLLEMIFGLSLVNNAEQQRITAVASHLQTIYSSGGQIWKVSFSLFIFIYRVLLKRKYFGFPWSVAVAGKPPRSLNPLHFLQCFGEKWRDIVSLQWLVTSRLKKQKDEKGINLSGYCLCIVSRTLRRCSHQQSPVCCRLAAAHRGVLQEGITPWCSQHTDQNSGSSYTSNSKVTSGL